MKEYKKLKILFQILEFNMTYQSIILKEPVPSEHDFTSEPSSEDAIFKQEPSCVVGHTPSVQTTDKRNDIGTSKRGQVNDTSKTPTRGPFDPYKLMLPNGWFDLDQEEADAENEVAEELWRLDRLRPENVARENEDRIRQEEFVKMQIEQARNGCKGSQYLLEEKRLSWEVTPPVPELNN